MTDSGEATEERDSGKATKERDSENGFSPEELHKRYLEFLNRNVVGHNAISELADMDNPNNCILESSGNVFLPVVESRQKGVNTDLFHNNKRLQEKNIDLEKKIDQLQRILEVSEDEVEQLKKQIDTKDKQLRCYDGIGKDREFLESEMDHLQSELSLAKERNVKYESHIKHMKQEKEDMLFGIKNQREEFDQCNKQLRSLSVSNKNLFDENTFLKNRNESLEHDLEMKEKELDENLQLYQEVREQAEEYRTSLQNVIEEKKMLVTKLQETQNEASLFQACVVRSPTSLRTPSSLQTEIEEAEEILDKQSSSPGSSSTNTSARSLNISIGSNYSYRKSQSLTQVILHVNEPTGREATLDPVRSHSGDLASQADHVARKEELQSLNQLVEQCKAKEEYLVHQLGQKQSKMRELISVNEKRAMEIALLCDIIHKLGNTKLEEWLADSKELKLLLEGTNRSSDYTESADVFGNQGVERLNEHFSQLVDALSLESVESKGAHLLRSRTGSLVSLAASSSGHDSAKKFLQRAEDLVYSSKSSIRPRMDILEKTKTVLEDAIVKKFDTIEEVLKEAAQWQQQGQDDGKNLHQLIDVSHDVKDHLTSTLDLIRRYGSCVKPIGALETEQRFSSIMEVFINHMKISNRSSVTKQQTSTCSSNAGLPSIRSSSISDISVDGAAANLDISEISIESITSTLMRSVSFPARHSKFTKFMQSVNGSQNIGSLVDSLLLLSGKFQNFLPIFGRTTMLMITFFLCTIFSISPVDYKVEPVY